MTKKTDDKSKVITLMTIDSDHVDNTDVHAELIKDKKYMIICFDDESENGYTMLYNKRWLNAEVTHMLLAVLLNEMLAYE